MPLLIVVGAVAVYSGIGLVIRAKRFPREPVSTAAIWPLALIIGRK